ncbi:MAG: DNA cytosine methyltransferase [Armatimonadetes bacterium]|nr:DNA cytosine methyltransferase [Armatimonadota bacterium]
MSLFGPPEPSGRSDLPGSRGKGDKRRHPSESPSAQAKLFDCATPDPPNDDAWFLEILISLGISQGPGWGDRFGDSLRFWLRERYPPIQTLSLFSGGGGLDVGFHDAGFQIVEMVEIDPKYAEVLRINAQDGGLFDGSTVVCQDIRDYHPDTSRAVEFIIGGPPCQSFSAAGRRAAGVQGTSDPRGRLFLDYVRVLETLRPVGFLFENVYGVTGAQRGNAWEEIQAAFREAGYSIFHRILDAADYGVPQHRERLFIVGLREGNFLFPQPTHGPDSIGKYPLTSSAEAIDGLETSEITEGIGGRFGGLLNDIPPGLNYSFYTEEMGHPNPVFSWRSKFSDFLYKADPQTPVRTLKAQVGAYSGPFHWENRSFTIPELKRLQTFPDRYRMPESRKVSMELIGNSVPPQIARMLAIAISNQVFGYGLPFPMRYLPENKPLRFRQRKHELTKIYAVKAASALRDLYARSQENQNFFAQDNEETRLRYINETFSWKTDDFPGATGIFLKWKRADRTLNIQGQMEEERSEAVCYTITLSPKRRRRWPLSEDCVRLQATSWHPTLLTGLWKALEEILSEAYGIADIVQLSGYYQYRPKIQAVMELASVPPEHTLWKILRHVIEGKGVARPCTESDLALCWDMDDSALLPYLKRLRVIGYEIRNRNTNPQIPEGVFLIPYAFPTLNPRSIQLRKQL